MKKTLIVLALTLLTMVMLCFVVSAETITVVDDGTTEITLGNCVIEDLGKTLPSPSRGFTYELNTENGTAKITNWAYSAGDAENGVNFVIPSTVTYNGEAYTVTSFNRATSANRVIELVAIPDTVTAIPNNAFDSLGALRYVYVGSGVETIGSGAFQWCGFTGDKTLVDENGDKVGDIKEFIWKTQKITKLSSSCFLHLDFNTECVIEFPFEKITVFESACMAYNPFALTSDHDIGRQLYLDVFDLRNATSVASDAFINAVIAETIIVNADQVNALSPQKLRGQGTAQPTKYSNFIICGGETPETAITLTEGVWYANAWYWYPGDLHFNVVFRGYVNAYDGVDGLENQNGYGRDVVDYFFESEEAFRHYISSVDSTTERVNTYTRYAKNTKGYFNVCVNDGAHSIKAYNLKYTPASEGVEESVEIVEYVQSSFAFGYPQLVTILDDDCTPSTVCWCCDAIFEKGIEHTLKTTIKYDNGYLSVGIKATTCENEGCAYCSNPEETAPLFINLGYSYGPDSMLQGFTVNKKALADYKDNTGNDIKYGLVAGSVNKLGEVISLFDESLNVINGAISVGFDDKEFDVFEMKVTGLKTEEYKSFEIYICAYVIENGRVVYLNNGTESQTATTISYNKIVANG